MLEAERLVGTAKAAGLFQPGSGGQYAWGPKGEGNVLLPLTRGGVVDIDWLNTLMSVKATTPEAAALLYAGGKVAWAVSHGILKRSIGVTWGHIKAAFPKDETMAAALAIEYGVKPWKFADLLHPDLVKAADRLLADFKIAKVNKPAPQPLKRPASPPRILLRQPRLTPVVRQVPQRPNEAWKSGLRQSQDMQQRQLQRSIRDASDRAHQRFMQQSQQAAQTMHKHARDFMQQQMHRTHAATVPSRSRPFDSPAFPRSPFGGTSHGGGTASPRIGPIHRTGIHGTGHTMPHERQRPHGSFFTFRDLDVDRRGHTIPGPFRGTEITRHRY